LSTLQGYIDTNREVETDPIIKAFNSVCRQRKWTV